MTLEYHVDCGCGLGRIYKKHGTAIAMCTRFSNPVAFAPYFVHKGCGGRLVLSVHPEGTITDERGRALDLGKWERARRKTKEQKGEAEPSRLKSLRRASGN
jgi:hypothetical protein